MRTADFASGLRGQPFMEASIKLMCLLVLVVCAGCHPKPSPSPHPISGYVQAKLYSDLAVAVALPKSSIAVPDIEVVAKNVSTGTTSAATHTDPFGYFTTEELPPGKYQICVSGTNFVSSCDPKVITIATQIPVLDHYIIISAKQHAVVGTVMLADKKTPCFWYAPTFDPGFVMTAKVALEDSSGTVVAGPIRGNNFGQYIMPTSAVPGSYKVTVACEAEHAATAIALSAASLKQDFELKDNPPSAHLLEAAKAGVGVRRASPGDALTIKATSIDADHDPLHYLWVDEGPASASFPDAATINWSAPATSGAHIVRVQVSDGRGGYAITRTIMSVGPDEMTFTGTVYNRATHAPVDAASVTLTGGGNTTTDANGHFTVSVPDTPRFVLNVSKKGFALTSRIFYARSANVQVPLDPVQTGPVDGKTGGTVNIKVTGCKPRDTGNDATGKPATNDSRTNECPKMEIGTLSFKFAPGSLMSGSTPFTGTATVEGFAFDLTLPNAIPGDQSAIVKGKDTRLNTFGAFHVTPRDSMGNALTMASGKVVEVTMPIHPLALATAPAKIPFFSYDEASGKWVEHGELTRSGNTYVGKIMHFSEFNADTIGGDSACLKVQLEQGPQGFPLAVRLNANYVSSSVGNFNHPDTVITDSNNPIVIERMVPNQDFHLLITDNTTNALLRDVVLNSGPAVAGIPFPVPYPYNQCAPTVVFNNHTVPPSSQNFLLNGVLADPFTRAQQYKDATTTGNYAGRSTLPDWLTTNHFGGGNPETHAVYFNNGDLKFGRNMHCHTVSHTGSPFAQDWIACYVSNFGTVGLDFADQRGPTNNPINPLSDATDGAYADLNPVATVTMEYHPDQTNAEVQFWAYKKTGEYFFDPDPTHFVYGPALDVEGTKPMPNICTGCHQGSFDPTTHLVKNGAKFLPFDIGSFLGDDGTALQNTIGTGGNRPTHADFRQLNLFALQASGPSGNPSTSYTSLMNLWYGNINNSGSTFSFTNGAAQLGTFPTQPDLYNQIVAPTCRTCHIARSPGSDTWDDESQMLTNTYIGNMVCDTVSGSATHYHYMPHAQVPYKRFWETISPQPLNNLLKSAIPLASCDP